RSDLAAAAALVGRPDRWIWDVRSFWADQRMDLGMLREGSPEERLLRRVELGAAARANGIVTLTANAVSVLAARHGDAIERRTVADARGRTPLRRPVPRRSLGVPVRRGGELARRDADQDRRAARHRTSGHRESWPRRHGRAARGWQVRRRDRRR